MAKFILSNVTETAKRVIEQTKKVGFAESGNYVLGGGVIL